MQQLITTYLLDPKSPPPWELTSFDALVDALRVLFGDLNLEKNAIVVLSNIHQTTLAVEYWAWFISHNQYTKMDGNTLASYFYRGLKDTINDLLAG